MTTAIVSNVNAKLTPLPLPERRQEDIVLPTGHILKAIAENTNFTASVLDVEQCLGETLVYPGAFLRYAEVSVGNVTKSVSAYVSPRRPWKPAKWDVEVITEVPEQQTKCEYKDPAVVPVNSNGIVNTIFSGNSGAFVATLGEVESILGECEDVFPGQMLRSWDITVNGRNGSVWGYVNPRQLDKPAEFAVDL